MNNEMLVVIGAGGIGQAIARRQGPGRHILLADINQDALATAATALHELGHRVTTHRVDVSSRESVHALAHTATELGPVVQVAHSAGLSPVQASPAAILAVDLLGTALVLDEFGRVIAPRRGWDRDLQHGRAHVPAV
jgi:NAD(P)-dependent dehydrogenase (short-subunit alcohol dehydrogenase family)